MFTGYKLTTFTITKRKYRYLVVVEINLQLFSHYPRQLLSLHLAINLRFGYKK
jgi:hypothetical protein